MKLEPLPRDWRHALGYAVYFSVLSAFHIGWRELNVGNWISRLQFRTYSLQATGWVRTVSGLQSLISVYLLAMWALTYFGRPFANKFEYAAREIGINPGRGSAELRIPWATQIAATRASCTIDPRTEGSGHKVIEHLKKIVGLADQARGLTCHIWYSHTMACGALRSTVE